MKRWRIAALALAMLLTSCLGGISGAATFAEDAEVVSRTVEEEVAPAEDAGQTGLVVEGAQPEATPEAAPEAAADTAERFEATFCRIGTEGAALYASYESNAPLGTLKAGGVALVLGEAAEGWLNVAVYTERGVIAGCVNAGLAVIMSDEEVSYYMDAIAQGAPAVLYQDDVNRPLTLAACAFDGEGEAAQEAESADEAQGEDTAAQDPAAPFEAQGEDAAAQDSAAPSEAQGEDESQPEGDAAVLAPEAQAGDEAETARPEGDVSAGLQLRQSEIVIGVKEVVSGPALFDGYVEGALTWRTSSQKYVQVDEATGAIRGAKKGSATVYATAADGQEYAVSVKVMKAPSKVTVTPKKLTMSEGGMTTQLTWSLPKKSASSTFTFASSNPAVATVDDKGMITTVSAGKATIGVKAFNGKVGTCTVTVIAAPASVSLPAESLGIAVGQSFTFEPTVLAADGSPTSASMTYTLASGSRNPDCVKLDSATGELVGVSKGQVIVVCTTHNGLSCRCTVNVASSPEAISLSATEVTLGVKEVCGSVTPQLTPPAGESECATALIWSSSNKKIATVDSNGVITGVKKGTCVITAQTYNGLSAKCKVTVLKAPGKIAISPVKGVLTVGESDHYTVKFPKNSGGSVAFASSDPAIAKIDAHTGVVTGVAPGSVVITVTAYNGKKAQAALVIKAPTVIHVDEDASVESTTTEYHEDMTNAEKIEYVIYMAQTQLGKPYIYGGGYSSLAPANGYDCSGLMYWSFRQVGIKLESSAYKQGYSTKYPKVEAMADLRRGDLVCFDTNSSDKDLSDHTGLYLGNGKFIHASSSGKKVMISSLASGYYNRTFSWGRRILP